jgi:hypothetical protein
MSSEPSTPKPASSDDAALVAPPDDQNPAFLDARKTFIYIVIGAAAFIGSVFVFIL